MKPEPRRFTKADPCTKLHLWQCFRGRRGWKRVQVDEAHAAIGLNAPRYMKDNQYLTVFEERNVEYYRLTERGQNWLETKFRAYLRNHPEDREKVTFLPKDPPAIKD